MNDVEYVKSVLAGGYPTERPHEIPYPALDDVVRATTYDYLAGTVDGEVPNGEVSRDGHPYLWFQYGGKSILSHRFIVAVTLGKWAPREFHVDHVNHNPSDNQPGNLRVVTPKDNAGNRRKALLSELADLQTVSLKLEERRRVDELVQQSAPKPQPIAKAKPVVVPIPELPLKPVTFKEDPLEQLRPSGPIPQVAFTGRTKRAEHSDGTWHETTLGSWHLKFD